MRLSSATISSPVHEIPTPKLTPSGVPVLLGIPLDHNSSTREALGYIHAVPGPMIGADLVEFNPVRDSSGLTATVAAKILKELLGAMIRR